MFTSAHAKAQAEETVRFEMQFELTGLPEELALDDEDAGKFTLTGSGEVDLAGHRMVMRGSAFGEESETRTIGDKVYESAGDGTWYESEVEGGGDFFASLFESADPLEGFQSFMPGVTSVESAGTEEVRGQKARKYTTHVDGSELDEIFDVVGGVDLAMWVDDEGRPVRMTIQMELEFPGFDSDPVSPISAFYSIDFFDYGKPVTIEEPAPDTIVQFPDLDDLSGGSPEEDYFAGADCYGDRVADCLAVNPELEAIAADPLECADPALRVCLVPVGTVRKDVVDAIVKFHRDTRGIEVLVLPGIPMEASWVSEDSQVTEYRLYMAMEERYGITDDTPSTFIAITPIDIVPADDRYGWMFGARFGEGLQGLNHGVFSYFRMTVVEPYDGSTLDDQLVQLRASKYVGRYVSLLHLDYPMGDDIDYLNYRDMYGFGDLDDIGTKWPEGPIPCLGSARVVCIVPDGDYEDPAFARDLVEAAARLQSDLGIRVEVRNASTTYFPSKDSWSDEYRDDLRGTIGVLLNSSNLTVIGFTDDALSQSSTVPDHLDRVWADERLAIASGFGAGRPGTEEHRKRLYNVLLRSIAQIYYGVPLDQDPSSLMFAGATEPSDLDGARAPDLR